MEAARPKKIFKLCYVNKPPNNEIIICDLVFAEQIKADGRHDFCDLSAGSTWSKPIIRYYWNNYALNN